MKLDGRTLVTNEVRLSYAYLEKPRMSADGKTSKYSCMLLIPKTDTELVDGFKQAIANAIDWGKQNGKGDAGKGRNPLRDGDTYTNMKGELLKDKAPEVAGHYIINLSANADNAPRLYAPLEGQPGKIRPAHPGEIYSGCYAKVYINFYPYNNQSVGVGAGLRSVCKTRDGELLGESGMSDTEAFGAEVVEDTAGDEFM